jgi:hypothetical protein
MDIGSKKLCKDMLDAKNDVNVFQPFEVPKLSGGIMFYIHHQIVWSKVLCTFLEMENKITLDSQTN